MYFNAAGGVPGARSARSARGVHCFHRGTGRRPPKHVIVDQQDISRRVDNWAARLSGDMARETRAASQERHSLAEDIVNMVRFDVGLSAECVQAAGTLSTMRFAGEMMCLMFGRSELRSWGI